jgi:hypothetical protein
LHPTEEPKAARPDVGKKSAPRSRPAAKESLYRIIWRWHFYAGVLIAPVLPVVAVTGALYIFRQEIEDACGAASK